MNDAYWNAKDEFEHDIWELFGQFMSPEEFEKKWRPIKEKAEKYDVEQQLTSREEYEEILMKSGNLINKHYNNYLESENTLKEINKIANEIWDYLCEKPDFNLVPAIEKIRELSGAQK